MVSKMSQIVIDNKKIGDDHPVYVIAEIGINHNGSIDEAYKLINLAKETGCDAVKFQKRTPELAVPKNQWEELKETPWGVLSYIDYKRKMEFDISQYKQIDKYCKKNNITWFASCWDELAVEEMASLDIKCFKIASASLTDQTTVNKMLGYDIPIILSTGMSSDEEISNCMEIIGNRTIGLLHTTSSYPCPVEELNLKMIETLKSKYNKHVIGYSGHESGLVTTSVAVAFGAKIIERHITLDRASWGSDHAASLAPNGLRSLIGHIRSVEQAIGDGVKVVYESEIPIKKKLRRNT
jgi:N-acetylneuraminate synthase